VGEGRGEAQATMAIMKGMETGIPPMQALENITIINGRSCIWGDLVPALLWSNGFDIDEHFENEDDDEKLVAICTVTRPNGKKITRKFSAADAKEAKLLGKGGPWTSFRKRMHQMRARGFASRDGAADVLKGLYIREEIEDGPQNATLDRAPIVPAGAIIDVPSAPPEQKQVAAEPALSGDGVLDKLLPLIEGAHTASEVARIWDEYSEGLSMAGRGAWNTALAAYEARLEQLPKQVDAAEELAASLPVGNIDMAAVPGPQEG